jgi:hypothetical protein
VDLDTVWGFQITNNILRDPGYTWGGYAPYCSGSALMMYNSAFNTVTGNIITSNDRYNNRLDVTYGPRDVYRRSAAYAEFSDLYAGGDTIIAFQLLQSPSAQGSSVMNVIDDNELRAACSSGCVGVGYFVSRGTGLDGAEQATLSTVNYFSRNDPYGSNIGSERCGTNWYAWDDTCDGTFPYGQCNGDDHQHTGFLRNDGCETY